MKVFISWSGDLSHRVAQAFRDWLPKVIQRTKPFISSQDIDKGNRWNAAMVKELQESAHGILCVTKDNLRNPWLNFEAGALSTKFIDKTQVAPFLFNIVGSDIEKGHPILQFQYVRYDREDVKKIMKSLNEACGSDCLNESDLDEVFDTWWPKLDAKLNAILQDADVPESLGQITEDSPETRRDRILEELLELVRRQDKRWPQSESVPYIYSTKDIDRLNSMLLNILSDLDDCEAEDRSINVKDMKDSIAEILEQTSEMQSSAQRSEALKEAARKIAQFRGHHT